MLPTMNNVRRMGADAFRREWLANTPLAPTADALRREGITLQDATVGAWMHAMRFSFGETIRVVRFAGESYVEARRIGGRFRGLMRA